MYTIIGGDGHEYGPVTVGQIRAWLAAGRANLDTQAKALGTDEWKRLGDFSDFGGRVPGVLPPMEEPPLARPAPPADADAKTIADDLISRTAPLDIAHCYERSWNLLKAVFWPLVGMGFLVTALNLTAERALMGDYNPFDLSTPSPHSAAGLLTATLVSAVFWGGLEYYILKKARGESTGPADAFAGFGRAFVPLVLAALLSNILNSIAFLLLVLPGIYLWVAYSFTYLLILDRHMGFWTAMEVSRRVITAQWWRFFGLLLLAIPFTLLGLAGLLVGVFIALPLIFGAVIYAYEDLCHPPSGDEPRQ